jgi:hypothetical protein
MEVDWNIEIQALVLWVPNQHAFKHSLAYSVFSPFVLVSFPLISSLEHGHFTLVETIGSLTNGQALNSLSFRQSLSILSIKLVNSKFQVCQLEL